MFRHSPCSVFSQLGRAAIEVLGIAFSDLTNTRSISAGTLTLAYWDELQGPSTILLSVAMGTTDTSFTVATAVSVSSGNLVQIDQEVMVVQGTVTSGTTVSVTRASHGTSAGTHAVGTGVYILAEKIFIMPFAQEFFGSPASGSYAFPITIPDVRIAAAELFMTNSRGNSSVAAESFTSTTDFGLRSLLGGQLTIQVEGHSPFRPTQRRRFWWRLRARCGTFMQWCRTRLPERPSSCK